jgi:hypothetical protein
VAGIGVCMGEELNRGWTRINADFWELAEYFSERNLTTDYTDYTDVQKS